MKRLCLALTAAALCSSPAFAETVMITKPNGGEQLCLGQTSQITWVATGVTGTIRLVLFKGGVKVENIVEVAAAPSMYNWNVGQTVAGIAAPGTDYTIKIVSAGGSDFSDAPFRIKSVADCGGGSTPTPTPGGGGIDPSILAKLRALTFIPVKIPGPGPGPCLSCPAFDLGSLLDLVTNPVGPLTVRLLKNGQPIATLGTIAKGQTMPRSVSPRLSAADFGLLKSHGANFEVGIFGANGALQHKLAVQF
jgi:hypothetical protein